MEFYSKTVKRQIITVQSPNVNIFLFLLTFPRTQLQSIRIVERRLCFALGHEDDEKKEKEDEHTKDLHH